MKQPFYTQAPVFQHGQNSFALMVTAGVGSSSEGVMGMVADGVHAAVVSQDQVVTKTAAKGNPKKSLKCWKCPVDTHAMKDCPVQHYCLVCDNTEHPTTRCPTLRLSKPSTLTAGFGTDETLFL